MAAPQTNSSQSSHPAPVTERRYLIPFLLITSLFFLWAFGVNLNDILIPRLKIAFALTDFQSSFIQVAFFGGYCLAAFPAGRLMERIGYKRGILCGLALCATGAVLFLPASSSRLYAFFLFALFVMACGQSFLEVASNPYATILGPVASADRRLNFAQSFNAVGAVLSPVVGRTFILTGVEYTPVQIAALSGAQLDAYRASEASTVKGPYLFIAAVFVAIGLLIYFTKLPEVTEATEASAEKGAGSLWAHRHLWRGVLAQFFYVGAQVGVASFVIRFTQFSAPGTTAHRAAIYLLLHQIGFMVGRFFGSGMMRWIPAPRLLTMFAGGALVCAIVALMATGLIPVWAVVLIGFFHSIMFPTIFSLSIKNLGALTKRGSSLLVMAILGGAVFPAIMGKMSDLSSIQKAFVIPLLCYIYIFYFGMWGSKPAPGLAGAAALGAKES
jgi:MFS transporter, FHS family, L-fucose permease